MENIENYKDALRAVQNKEIEQRKTIKKLLQEREELKKQLALYDVVKSLPTKNKIDLDGLFYSLMKDLITNGLIKDVNSVRFCVELIDKLKEETE